MELSFHSGCIHENIDSFYFISKVFVYCMFVAQMAFHAKISDPTIGGTYMTLLNTVANMGKLHMFDK